MKAQAGDICLGDARDLGFEATEEIRACTPKPEPEGCRSWPYHVMDVLWGCGLSEEEKHCHTRGCGGTTVGMPRR